MKNETQCFNTQQPTSEYLTFNREIDITTPEAVVPEMEDVFRALPKINRFNGQTIVPYSVAQHSIMCTNAAEKIHDCHEPHRLMAILLHDAGEAYVGDIVRFVKQTIGKNLLDIEDHFFFALLVRIGLTPEELEDLQQENFKELLNEIDNRMGATEADVLRSTDQIGAVLPEMQRYSIILPLNLGWQETESHFRFVFNTLREGIIERRENENS